MTNSFFSTAQTDLTEKELEVLRLIAEGWKVNKIAEKLFLSPFTIMAHRRNIMKKLDLHSAAELVKYAYEHKLN
jgi:DNA-binding NarL/FixJ family response regulator